ncbi:TPA: hypothetical protein QFD76_001171 [Enterococcus faecium]|uniref:DUF4315 family protein n=1 Tax=Enterococcus faecium TaxID=1352 RepID=A0A6A8NIZ9_ENTFC|nr:MULTISPECIES: hypothetical protein [Enterococcus]EEU75556.1 predicted protein [Enterococcus faecalis JH1]EOI86576.1 hypothetical protein UM9_03228 [Enterococcus faecalis EnGen0298]MBD9751717.1 hypothetical protein [Enterococcus faecium]MDQ2047375.1 hypothetical protein [Enterococcus faecium]MTD24793.1 hypothetical protein [Enterococcus faecium]
MARKSLTERIQQKKEEATKLEKRIQEDQDKLEKLVKQIRELEAEQVLAILDNHKLSVKDLNKILSKQPDNNNFINHN